MDKSAQQTLKETNDSGVALLFTDLDLAHTMLDRAELVEDATTRERNLQNVEKACASAQHFMGKLQLTDADRSTLSEKLAALRQRLAQLRRR
jgi:hypothetical protein